MIIRCLAGACALAALPYAFVPPCHADAAPATPAAPVIATPATPAAPVIATPATPAAPAIAATVDPKALALLGDVDEAMKNVHGMTADFTNLSTFDPAHPVVQQGVVRYLKPNYQHIDAWVMKKENATGKLVRDGAPMTVASDGKNRWIVTKAGEYYQYPDDPAGKGMDTAFDPAYGFFDESRAALKQLGEQQTKHLLVSLAYAGKQDWEGQKYDVVDWTSKPGFDLGPELTKKAPNGVVTRTDHVFIGSDHLIHRTAYEYNIGWSGERALENLKINPTMTAKNFVYTLPAGAHPPKPQPPAPPVLANGAAAPDFLATTPDGAAVHLSDYKGKRVILDFWATWCGPCQRSMPHLDKVYQQVKDKDVVVLAVCVWDAKDAYAKWVANNKTTYAFPTLFDPAGKVGKNIAGELYHVSGIPTQFVIDKDGKVVASNVGYMGETDHRLEAELAKIGVDIPVPTDTKP